MKRSLSLVVAPEGPIMKKPKMAAMSLTKRIKKAVEKTKEHKFLDRRLLDGTDVISSTATVQKCSAISQGITDNERVGDSINATSFEARVVCGAGSVPAVYRLVIFQWRADDATAPVVGDVLELSGSATAYNAPYNHDKRSQFRIVDDVRVSVSPNGPQISEKTLKYFGKKITKEIKYLAAGTTGYNQFYTISVSSAATNGPVLRLDTRLNYTDA